jgi:hypothetical protein
MLAFPRCSPFVLPLIALACSAGAGDLGKSGNGSGGASSGGGGGTTSSGGSVASGGTGMVFIDPGNGGSSTGGAGGSGGGCTAVSAQAEKSLGGEADIIWIIDNSGSMFDEATAVQNNMNFFSGFIQGTGIDVRVVVISSPPPLGGLIPPYGVCVEPPLGNGTCPNDSTYPGGNYLHVIQEVASNNGLQVAIDTYPQWEPIIRPTATKTFVIVTDDEADPIPGAQGFTDWVNGQPKFQGALWRFSGLFCQAAGLNCFAIGSTYLNLATATGGVAADIGNPDWSVIFQQLADAVIADAVPVDCEWVIPPPPDGETLDPNLVDVSYTAGSGTVETVFGVESAAGCSDQFLGWYYDNPTAPTKLIACDTTCPVLQADDSARIEVAFGCERPPPPDIR